MTTVRQFLESLQTDIFSDAPGTEFEKYCREREKGLKQYIETIGIIVSQLVSRPEMDNNKMGFWKKEKIKSSINNLTSYCAELTDELTKENIEKYCKTITPNSLFKIPFNPDTILLMLNSYYGSIVTDIYWIRDLSISESMQISAGKLDLDTLGKKTKPRIQEITSLIKANKNIFKEYAQHIDSIEEAICCYKKNFLKAFNLMLLTSIEGLTRQLGIYLVNKQTLNVDPYSDDYNSLDKFLRCIPWKKDFTLRSTDLILMTGHYERINLNDPKVARTDPMELIDVTVKTRLDFLRRRFKENRDLILHGQETEYNKPYHGFINSSALYEVLKSIVEAHKKYPIN